MPIPTENDRDAAGAAYLAATNAFVAAAVELAAIERVLCSAPHCHTLPSFGLLPDRVTLRHVTYAPDIGGNWASDIEARARQIAAS